MNSKKSILKIVFTGLLVCASISASADTFSFSVVAAGVTGSGSYTAVPGATTGVQNITGISGSVNGVAISQLIPGNYNAVTPSKYSFADGVYFNYDNLAYATGTTFDLHGVLFELTNGIFVNLFYTGSVAQIVMLDGDPAFDLAHLAGAPSLLTTAAVTLPEPASVVLLGSGLLSLAGLLRWRLRSF